MQEYDVIINHDICVLCEDCIETCQEDVFELNNEEQKVVVKNEINCSGCKDCVEICSPMAIYVGESLEKIKADRDKRKKQAKNRDSSFSKLIEKYGKDESGECKIPLNEVLQSLNFRSEDELDDWFLNKDDFIAIIDEEEVIVTPYESEE